MPFGVRKPCAFLVVSFALLLNLSTTPATSLDRLLAGETDYEALRPDVWKLTHPEAVRQYRAEERTTRADAKAKKRARR